MRRFWSFLLLMSVLLLTACSLQTPAPTVTIVPTQPPAQTSTPTLLPMSVTGPATCTMVSLMPTPDPTQASLFPAVTDKDWSEGSEEAKVTFLEYSDFQ